MAHTTSSSSPPSSSGEFGRGKTIFVLAVVVGCFAVLWPKVFYPMFTASIYPTPDMDDQGNVFLIDLYLMFKMSKFMRINSVAFVSSHNVIII